jgi:Arc/MetJ-type ribon-helix-helix transcriptional regulator
MKEKYESMSDGVKDCVKFIIKQIKEEKKNLEQELKDEQQMGHFSDCGDFYREQVLERKTRIDTMIEMKIKLEKYSKKLKQMSNEFL